MTGMVSGLAAAALVAGLASSAAEQPAEFQCRRPHLQQMSVTTVDVAPDTRSCLIDAARVTASMPLVDLRPRQDYVAYHAPGASNQQLSQLLSQRPKGIVVYDAGRLRQDAELLCTRLQRYGLRDARVVDGGIAALARHKAAPQAVALSRLGDAEVAAALVSGSTRIQSLAPAHGQVISTLGLRSAAGGQTVLLAQQQPQIASRFSAGKGGGGVYWVGEPARLQQLVQVSQAQERKREEGPGYNPNCSAL